VELPVGDAAANCQLMIAAHHVRSLLICDAFIVKRLGPGLFTWNPLPDTMNTPTCGA
jgi:hypothetical protein